MQHYLTGTRKEQKHGLGHPAGPWPTPLRAVEENSLNKGEVPRALPSFYS